MIKFQIFRYYRNNNGGILLEVLISLGISGLLINLWQNQFRTTLKVSKENHSIHSETYKVLKLKQYLFQITEDLNTHPLHFLPVIHTNGRIRFSDSSINPVNRLKNNPPAKRSEALTAYLPDIKQIYIVKSFQNSSEIRACKLDASTVKYKYRSFIGVSADSLTEFRGKRSHYYDNCFNFKLYKQKSMLFKQSASPTSIHMLIPLKRIYTFYLSRKGDIRYLSHSGSENIENQPLISNVKSLQFKDSYNNHTGIYELTASIRFKNSNRKVREITVRNTLSRKTHYSFILGS